MVICLERGADLHMAQLMPLPLTVSCFSKIQIGFTFLVPAHLSSPGKGAVKRVCVSAEIRIIARQILELLLLLYTRSTASFPGQLGWAGAEGKTSLDLNEARNYWVWGWQWHHLDYMQTICISLQTDNHTNTSSVNFYRPDAFSDAQPCQNTEGTDP